MRKSVVIALMAALGIAGGTSLSAQAADTGNIYQQLQNNGFAVIGGEIKDQAELEQIMGTLKDRFNITDWNNCTIITPPESNQPDTELPDTELPDTETPGEETPDADNTPENTPGTDSEKPGTDTDKPDADTESHVFAKRVVELVNEERAKAGLGALTLDKSIESAALIRAKETEVSFSHTRPDGRSFSSVLTDHGINFRGSGENIAWGQQTPEEVMNGWMNSDGHRANILNSSYTNIGVGYYQNSAGQKYWTQLFTY